MIKCFLFLFIMAYNQFLWAFEGDLQRALNKGCIAAYIQTGANKTVEQYGQKIYFSYVPSSYRYYLDHVAPLSKMVIEQKFLIIIEF